MTYEEYQSYKALDAVIETLRKEIPLDIPENQPENQPEKIDGMYYLGSCYGKNIYIKK